MARQVVCPSFSVFPNSFIDSTLDACPDVQRHSFGFLKARPVRNHDGHKAFILARVPAMDPDVIIVIDQGNIVCSFVDLAADL